MQASNVVKCDVFDGVFRVTSSVNVMVCPCEPIATECVCAPIPTYVRVRLRLQQCRTVSGYARHRVRIRHRTNAQTNRPLYLV